MQQYLSWSEAVLTLFFFESVSSTQLIALMTIAMDSQCLVAGEARNRRAKRKYQNAPRYTGPGLVPGDVVSDIPYRRHVIMSTQFPNTVFLNRVGPIWRVVEGGEFGHLLTIHIEKRLSIDI